MQRLFPFSLVSVNISLTLRLAINRISWPFCPSRVNALLWESCADPGATLAKRGQKKSGRLAARSAGICRQGPTA